MKKKVIFLSCMLVFPQIVSLTVANAQSVVTSQSNEELIANAINLHSSLKDTVSSKIPKEKALEIAKNFIEIPKEYEQESIGFQNEGGLGNRKVWQINWSKQIKGEYGNIFIVVDAERGQVLSMNRWEDSDHDSSTYPPTYTYDRAKEIAEKFLQEKHPDKVGQVQLDSRSSTEQKTPLGSNVTYYYRFHRVENNIPFMNQFIYIEVNGEGEVVGYDYQWTETELTIPDPTGMMAQTEAEKRIKDEIILQLKYKTLLNSLRLQDNEQTIHLLSYDQRNPYSYMDAKTGQWLDYSGQPIDENELNSEIEILFPESKPIDIVEKKQWTQEEIMQMAEEKLHIPSEAVLKNISFHAKDTYHPFSTWNIIWTFPNDSQTIVHASINAETGEILSYSKYEPVVSPTVTGDGAITQVISYQEALQKAKNGLKIFVPTKLNELVFDPLQNRELENWKEQRNVYFTFHRSVNGIVVEDQYMRVGISTESGEVIEFYQNWNEQDSFPDPKNIISIENAKDVYLQNFTISPQYLLIEQTESDASKQMKTNSEVKLVYYLEQKPYDEIVYLDALQGKWLSKETQEPLKEQKKAKDITGHANEKALQLLIEYGAISVDDEGFVKPDEDITRGEMVKMLMLVTNPDPYYYKVKYARQEQKATFSDVEKNSTYFPYIESAVEQGYIEKTTNEFKPNDSVTREEVAKMIVKVLGYDDLAQVSSLFNLPFLDADDIEYKGHAAIVYYLDIIPALNQRFEPDKHVTRGEGAQMFYNFLKQRDNYHR